MGGTALHYAAAYSAHSALVSLIRSGRCDYLIRDNRGMYPSEVAYEIADDPRVGAILAKKEARQAQETGVQACPMSRFVRSRMAPSFSMLCRSIRPRVMMKVHRTIFNSDNPE